MVGVYDNMLDLIGNTPILNLKKYKEHNKLSGNIFAKLECFNPAGSIKDRIARAMIEDAEYKGKLNKNTIIIEPTSGNTGIGLAAVAASKGYKLILTMPETMSVERQNLLKAYGAEIVLTEGSKGMLGAIKEAERLSSENKNSFIPMQFENPMNPDVHRRTTGPEIWEAMRGKIDIFVAGVGTGGTISGVGEFLKSKNSQIKVVAVEPFGSPVLSKGTSGPHKIQGIGAGFVPKTLNTKIYDQIIAVKDEDAFATRKMITSSEGLLLGISSAAALWAATQLARDDSNLDKNIVVILPDSGEKYLSVANFI